MIGDTLEADLIEARAEVESRMLDTVMVTRGGGEWLNPDTDEYESVPVETVYSGKARIRHQSIVAKDVEAASQLLVIAEVELHVPVGTAVFRPDDQVSVTASPTRTDQVGREFVVVAPFDGSQSTAVRYRIESADAR